VPQSILMRWFCRVYLVMLYAYPREFRLQFGGEMQQLSWLSSAMQDLQTYPLVKALIYFNADEAPGVWDTRSTTPHWSISESGLSSLVSVPVSVGTDSGASSHRSSD